MYAQTVLEFFKKANDKTGTLFEGGIFTTLIVWAVIAALTPLLLHVVRRISGRVKSKQPQKHVPLVEHLLRALIYIFAAIGITMQILPLKSTMVSLLATSGVLAVVLGLASQQAFTGLVSGAFISIFKPFVIGDRISVASANVTGYVEDITLYHTVIRNLQNNRVVIPNALMNGYVIENISKQDNTTCNYLDVSVAYSADLGRAMGLMKTACEAHPDCVDADPSAEGKVVVRVVELGDSGITLRAFVWSADAAKGFNMTCDLRRQVKEVFDKNGIEIPFPCTNVYMRGGN